MLARLRGNFVLLIHDPRDHSLLLACDQLGTRSLFFRADGDRLIFATEVHSLLQLLPSRPPPDELALVRWLAETTVGDGRTLYEGVSRLGAGRLLRAGGHGLELRRYWSPVYAPPRPMSRREAAEAARSALGAAVRAQLPAEGGCGVMISGGLDSSSVAALSREMLAPEVSLRAYSALFPDHASIDESALIGDAVADLGLGLTSITVHGGSMVHGSLEYLQRWELPAAAPNHFLWQSLLSQAAREGTTVILDGEGGDELWGFSPYLAADLLRSGRPRSALRLTGEMLGAERNLGWRQLMPFLRLYGAKGALPPSLHHALRRLRASQHYAPPWFTARSARMLAAQRDQWAWKHLDGPRWWAYMADLLTASRERLGVGEYLRHRAAMTGLEARHPLIDVDLIEFALSLPPRLALDPRFERPLLRDAMVDLIPDSIRLRPEKSYFTALLESCLGERDLPVIRHLLEGTPEITAYVDIAAVTRDLLAEPPGKRGSGAWAWSVWRLLTAECWLRSQEDSSFVENALDLVDRRSTDWAFQTITGQA
jgi:asparagine synthase (glutamine-hydrolysing)